MSAVDALAILRRSWIILAGHIRDYARLAAAPFGAAVMFPVMAAAAGLGSGGRLLGGLLALLAAVPLITAWQRFVMLGHGEDRGCLVLQWKHPEWLFVWALAQLAGLALVAAVPASLAATVFTQVGIDAIPGLLLNLALTALVGLVMVPFLLVLPAAAVDVPLRLYPAMRLLDGAAVPLGLLAVALSVPSLLVAGLWPASESLGLLLLGNFLLQVVSFSVMPVVAAALSLTLARLAAAEESAHA